MVRKLGRGPRLWRGLQQDHFHAKAARDARPSAQYPKRPRRSRPYWSFSFAPQAAALPLPRQGEGAGGRGLSTATTNRHTITPLHAAQASPISPLDGIVFAIAQPAMLVETAHAI